MTAPRKKSSKAKAQAALNVESRGFNVTLGENGFNVENNSFNDIEMLGVLTVLLDAYRERFNLAAGGGTDGKS